MSQKETMLRRLREIGEILGSDLGWIDPERRRVFVDNLVRERDSYLDVVTAGPARRADLPAAQEVLRGLRADPESRSRAAALEAWMRDVEDA